jgi:oligo-1,6-glucosidase
MEPQRTWWKEAVVYQIYPRSFKDSNADGVGDLKGIIQRLDYIQSLGVDAVWLNPIYQSPYDDGGYDISDYQQIHHEFGTMDDFDRLLTGLHQRGLRLIMDLVVNHSSDEHRWFIESRKDVNNPYRDYYFWKPGKDQEPPNNWPSFFGGSAWQLDEPTGEYYLHLFSKKQPDLNWEHEPLRQEVADIMRFWLDKGVDGLRLDVISAISKRVDFPDSDTYDFNETIRKYYANGPRLKEFIRELRHQVWNNYDLMTVGEGPGITPENALEYLNESDGLNMIFHFGHMFMDQGPGGRFDPIPWTLRDFKTVFKQWDDALHKGGWGSVFLGNHDFARMVSRWGNDHEFLEPSAKLLITLLLSMRGTPFIFAGDELGMTNTVLTSIEESKDIETLNGWLEAKNQGMSETDFLKRANYAGRDNARTPFQWSDQPFAGFSSVTPWMPVNPNFSFLNRDSQEASLTSVLNYFRSMVELRKSNLTLVYGRYVPCSTLSDSCYAYFRENEQEKLLVVLNFSNDQLILEDSLIPSNALRLLGNYPIGDRQNMQPWEAVIYKL